MTDILQPGTTCTKELEAKYILRPESSVSSTPASKQPQDLEALRDVVSKYVGQLLNGCGDPGCVEVLCDTGRHNTSQRPFRKYTPRSARAVAITLASGPKPRARLCPRYEPSNRKTTSPKDERPRDPSSLSQLLSDTKIVSSICRPHMKEGEALSVQSPLKNDTLYLELQYSHAVLDNVADFLSSNRDPLSLEPRQDALKYVADQVYVCIKWLVSTLNHGNAPHTQWWRVNNIISHGCSYPTANLRVPSDETSKTWLHILDGLQCGPSLRLLSRVLDIKKDRANGTSLWGDHHAIDRLARRIADRRNTSMIEQEAVIVWLKHAFLQHWNGEYDLCDVKGGATALRSLQILNAVRHHMMIDAATSSYEIREDLFDIPVVPARVDAVALVQNLMNRDRLRGPHHLLMFEFLFTKQQKMAYFRMLCHLRMRNVHSKAEIASAMRGRAPQQTREAVAEGRLKYLEEHYLLLNVSRGNVLKDAFDQLWQRRSSELLRPLRVRLGEIGEFEIGHDLGGVQIEFLNLVCKDLLHEDRGMFTTDPGTGLSYFRPGSLQPLYMFELCGLLFGLALHNGITLPVNFPKAFYCILLDWSKITLSLLEDGWPTVKKSLDAMLRDEIAGLDAVLPLEANGLRLTVVPPDESIIDEVKILNVVEATSIIHHKEEDFEKRPSEQPTAEPQANSAVDIDDLRDSWPGWRITEARHPPLEVTSENKAQYVRDYTFWLVYGSVAPQWESFLKGFFSVIDRDTLKMLTPSCLHDILEGSARLDIDELRYATSYDGFDPDSRYIKNFWKVVGSWSDEKQKQLLKFVTAAERVPASGAGNLTFKIHRATPASLEHLPTSSTCFGTLMLPKYPSVEILDEKLSLAIKYGLEGFGTG